ncbi:MAG: glycosyltransferase 2 family protein [Thermodesulfobacteriota bacterium]|nr:glycosyltransferase 2 family protein [Thermodesulfobacteriota bacterium]
MLPLIISGMSWDGLMSETNANSTFDKKRAVLVIIGCALGAMFLYLTFRDIPLNDLKNGIKDMQVFYLLPATGLAVMCQVIRALRFGVILDPFCRLNAKSLWDLMNIWAAANMIMPARLAEFIRPYLLVSNGASFSSSLGAVMVERFFDLTGLLTLLAVVLWRSPHLPTSFAILGEVLLAALVVGYIVVLAILARRQKAQKIIDKILSIFPHRAASFLSGIVSRLIEGIGIMSSFPRVVLIVTYSITLWVLFALITYMFLLAFSIDAPFLVAVTIQVLMALGVALPSAPGFIGTFHAVGRYALALFGINAVVAVSFATVYHLFSVLISILLGLLSYATGSYRFGHSMFGISSQRDSQSVEG